MVFDATPVLLGYLGVSFLFLYAALNFERQSRIHLPMRILFFFVSLFILLQVPGLLNNYTYAHDSTKENTTGVAGIAIGELNVTQVNRLLANNSTLYTALMWPIILLLFWLVGYYLFFRLREDISDTYGHEAGQIEQSWRPKRGGR